MTTLETQDIYLRALPSLGSTKTVGVSADVRVRVLLLRSTLSALTTIATHLSTFSHPFIQRILTSALPLHDLAVTVAGASLLSGDVQRTLSLIFQKIPFRLSIPSLLQSVPCVLKCGHIVSSQFGSLLSELWGKLERTVIVSHINDLFAIAVLCFDYRRVYGDISTEADMVEATVVGAVSQLCLKLTETELRGFLARMAEWRDADVSASTSSSSSLSLVEHGKRSPPGLLENYQKHSRSCSFYLFIAQLSSKLKSIFVPCMSIVWADMTLCLQELGSIQASLASSSSASLGVNGKSQKKRKLSGRRRGELLNEDVDDVEATEDESNVRNTDVERARDELVLRGGRVLETLRLTCSNDIAGFIDEVLSDWPCHHSFHFLPVFCLILLFLSINSL